MGTCNKDRFLSDSLALVNIDFQEVYFFSHILDILNQRFWSVRIEMFGSTFATTIFAKSTAHLKAHCSTMYLKVIRIIKVEEVLSHETCEYSLE